MLEARVPLSEDTGQHGRNQQGLASPRVKREQGNMETPPSSSPVRRCAEPKGRQKQGPENLRENKVALLS